MSSSPEPVVLVTGANRGLGLGILEVLIERQPRATYLLGSRDQAAGEKAAAVLRASAGNPTVEVLQLDVTDDAHIAAAVDLIRTKYGRLDVLVNNAGILRPPNWQTLSLREIFHHTLDANLVSVGVLTTECLPLLHAASAPRVVTITSGVSSLARARELRIPRVPTYGGSKTGVNAVSMHMQGAEWDRIRVAREKGEAVGSEIRFFICQPGITRTSFTQYTIGKEPRDGAEVAVQLVMDADGQYPGGTYWEFEKGKMSEVPW